MSKSGISRRQGGHHDAQKFNTTGRPSVAKCSASEKVPPSNRAKEKSSGGPAAPGSAGDSPREVATRAVVTIATTAMVSIPARDWRGPGSSAVMGVSIGAPPG